jgi:Tfp pilus assembly pilus retraction ATPase PilT
MLTARQQAIINNQVKLRFVDYTRFNYPEALIAYEQSFVSEEKLAEMCNCKIPKEGFIPTEIVNALKDKNCVPISVDVVTSTLTVGTLDELSTHVFTVRNYKINAIPVPIFYFVKLHTRYYGIPAFLAPLPIRDKFEMLTTEAIERGASDITITTIASGATVYYNCRKKKILSHHNISAEDVSEICKLLASSAGSPVTDDFRSPKYLSVRLDMHNRGRVVINRTYYGYAVTIRVLNDYVLNTTLEDLHIKQNTISFIRNYVLSREKGLRLFVGETMSGKNTTILSALRELSALGIYKIVSLESPVEILVDGIEQINAETPETFSANADSFLRQNPDIAYFTEISNTSANSIMRMSNTGKVTFSTIHANSISDVIARLQDITGLSSDRVVISMHSCVYQELVRDDISDKVFPINKCILFTDNLKKKLYGKSTGDIKTILQEQEMAWEV